MQEGRAHFRTVHRVNSAPHNGILFAIRKKVHPLVADCRVQVQGTAGPPPMENGSKPTTKPLTVCVNRKRAKAAPPPQLPGVELNKSARHLKRIVSAIAANWLFAAIISSQGHI